jgi:DNA-directed RNA polymerase subunit K/omega
MADYESDDNEEILDLDPEIDNDNDDDEITIEELLSTEDTNNCVTDTQIYTDYLDEEKQTINKLTKYERTTVIGTRAQQLANGAQPLVKVDKKDCDVTYIATKELMENKLPFIIKRKITENKVEYWRLSDLII